MESINFALNTTSLTYTDQDYFILVSYTLDGIISI